MHYFDVSPWVLHVTEGVLGVVPNEMNRVKISSTYRYMFVSSGEAILFVNGSSYHLHKNDICYFRPQEIYQTTPLTTMFVINIYFTMDRSDRERIEDLKEIDRTNVVQRYAFEDLCMWNESFVLHDYTSGLAQTREILMEKDNILSDKRRSTLLDLLTIDLTRHKQAEENKRQLSSLAQEILQYIANNIREPLTAKILTEQFHYHPSYISTLIKKATGFSLHSYVMSEKIKSATEALVHTDRTIAEIAQEYSFYDSSHFTHCYWRFTGLLPSEIRSAARKGY